MPIPFLLAGAGILAGVVGVGGHIDAKETNEIAQARRDKAKNMYDKEKVVPNEMEGVSIKKEDHGHPV